MGLRSRAAFFLILTAVASSGIAMGQRFANSPPRKQTKSLASAPAAQLVRPEDGLAILSVTMKMRAILDTGYDCSHLVHLIYDQAGLPYEYATAAQLYAGVSQFRRVRHPQPGDLVVFPRYRKQGHVGIIVSAAEHFFFSGLSHGPSVSSYASPYWRARGYPRFFRYVRIPQDEIHIAAAE